MADGTGKDGFDRLADLVSASFPNLSCLRCGHDQFYLTDDPAAASLKEVRSLLGLAISGDDGAPGPVAILACRRCGYVEQHLTDVLQQAEKPLPRVDGLG
jgi:predicted nucleic-acid-binding Zn-ribbon protein